MYPDKDFNNIQMFKIERLLQQRKETYRVDLHIHTNHSVDGLQTIEHAIERAKKRHFDIISITDHDSIAAYDEIISKQLFIGKETPIIIPGVEFTVSYPLYEGRCHVLKYFYDAKDTKIQDIISHNKQAFINRVEIWFERIQENKCLQSFFKNHEIICKANDYWDFLKKKHILIPDYLTIMEYLYSLLSEKNIHIWDVYKKALTYNEMDSCDLRKEKKTKLLKRFYNKYKNHDISHNFRKLKPILAPLGIDDADYGDYDSSGSLTVHEYGQAQIYSLKNSGINVLAHPDINKLYCVDNLLDCISGLEINWHSQLEANEKIHKKAKNMSLFITKGSDEHSYEDKSYENISFYNMSYMDLNSFIWNAKKSIK